MKRWATRESKFREPQMQRTAIRVRCTNDSWSDCLQHNTARQWRRRSQVALPCLAPKHHTYHPSRVRAKSLQLVRFGPTGEWGDINTRRDDRRPTPSRRLHFRFRFRYVTPDIWDVTPDIWGYIGNITSDIWKIDLNQYFWT